MAQSDMLAQYDPAHRVEHERARLVAKDAELKRKKAGMKERGNVILIFLTSYIALLFNQLYFDIASLTEAVIRSALGAALMAAAVFMLYEYVVIVLADEVKKMLFSSYAPMPQQQMQQMPYPQQQPQQYQQPQSPIPFPQATNQFPVHTEGASPVVGGTDVDLNDELPKPKKLVRRKGGA